MYLLLDKSCHLVHTFIILMNEPKHLCGSPAALTMQTIDCRPKMGQDIGR